MAQASAPATSLQLKAYYEGLASSTTNPTVVTQTAKKLMEYIPTIDQKSYATTKTFIGETCKSLIEELLTLHDKTRVNADSETDKKIESVAPASISPTSTVAITTDKHNYNSIISETKTLLKQMEPLAKFFETNYQTLHKNLLEIETAKKDLQASKVVIPMAQSEEFKIIITKQAEFHKLSVNAKTNIEKMQNHISDLEKKTPK